MNTRIVSRASAGIQLPLLLLLLGCSVSGPHVRIIEPWASQPAGPMASTVAGFMCFHNDGTSPIRIVGASSESVETVEIHEIVHEQGIVRMKRVGTVLVPAHGRVCFEPEKLHFMFIGIADAVRTGANIRLLVSTDIGETLNVELPQRGLGNAN